MKYFWLAALIVSITPMVVAQTNNNKTAQNDPNTIRIYEKDPIAPDQLKAPLALTEQQFATISKFYTAKFNEEKKLDADTAVSKEDKNARKKQLRDIYIADTRKVLTAEQQKKLDEILNGGKKSADPDQMKFTEEQRKKIGQMSAKYRAEMEKIKNDRTIDEATRRERLQNIQRQMMNEFRSILDPKTQGEVIKGVDSIMKNTEQTKINPPKKEEPKKEEPKKDDPNKAGDKPAGETPQ